MRGAARISARVRCGALAPRRGNPALASIARPLSPSRARAQSPYDKRPPVSTYGRGSHGIQAPGAPAAAGSMLDYGERKPSDEWNRSTWPGAEGGETENGAGAAWPSNPDAADGE